MQNMRIASYKITQGTFTEVADAAKDGMLKSFRKSARVPSIRTRRYRQPHLPLDQPLGDPCPGRGCVARGHELVREHLADKVELTSTQVGDLAFFEGVPARV